jgi:hypothetical protein
MVRVLGSLARSTSCRSTSSFYLLAFSILLSSTEQQRYVSTMPLDWSKKPTQRFVASPFRHPFRCGMMFNDTLFHIIPGKVFQVYSPDGPQVFILPNMMDEVKAFPDNVLSIIDAFSEVCLDKGEERQIF